MELFVVIFVIVAMLAFFYLLIEGGIKTFVRQPVVAILCIIFLFPFWVIWALIESMIGE